MRVVYSLGDPSDASGPLGAAICAVSTFDGVHVGHLALAARAGERARAQNVPVVAVVVWEGERAGGAESPGAMLTLLDERLALLKELARFDAALVISQAPGTPPLNEAGLHEAIERHARPVALLRPAREAGMPAGGSPTWSLIEDTAYDAHQAAGQTEGVMLEHATANRRTRGERIAGALLAGDVRAASELLGHPHSVGGVVVSGDRRGRLLGYPTANLRLDARKALPANGIYAVRAKLPGERRATHPAVVSLGVRPQFRAGNPRLLEVYLLDAELDLYGLPLRVEFVERLREERRFSDVEALKAQMARDVTLAREALS